MFIQARSKELVDFLYGGPYPKGYPAGCEKQLARRPQMLKAAQSLQDLRIPPG
jgi:proteic killer suppression protein